MCHKSLCSDRNCISKRVWWGEQSNCVNATTTERTLVRFPCRDISRAECHSHLVIHEQRFLCREW